MKQITLTGIVIFALTACATTEEGMFKHDPKAIDVTFSSAAHKDAALGFLPTRIETVSQRHELQANCTLTGNQYSVSFRTPKTINLPSYGKSTHPINIKCTTGDFALDKTIKAVNMSQQARTGNALAVGLLAGAAGGIVVGTGQTVGNNDVYGYGTSIDLEF